MDVMTSARHFVRHVREEGWYSIPPLLYARWMALRCRPYLKQEAASRAQAEEDYQAWIRAQLPSEDERARQAAHPFTEGLSILIPTYNTRPELLAALVDSLLAQTCPRWEACLYDGASPDRAIRRAIAEQARRDPRIRVEMGKENLGISGNTNRALAMASYRYVALLDHDDLLTPDAVYCVLRAAEDGADMIYSDEDKCNADGTRFFEPHLKSDFAPDSLRSGNYICHLMAMDKSLMLRAGSLRTRCDGSQDHDLALRASELAGKITHIPRILYHWRMLDSSVSHTGAARCANAAVLAVQDQLERRHLPGKAHMEELRVRISGGLPAHARISLIVVAEEKGTARYLRMLHRRTADAVHEVLVVGGASEKLRFGALTCGRVHGDSGAFDGMNLAARQATGDYLVFIRQGITPQSRSWISEMGLYAQREDVGCVGTALMDRRYFYLHAGYAVDVPGGVLSHQAGAFLYGNPYMITDRIVRNVTAVSGAQMMISRDRFLSLGGFTGDEDDLAAVTLGIRCLEDGLVNVFTPFARSVVKCKEPPCLTQPLHGDALAAFRTEVGEHPTERYYSPLFEKKLGSMTLDLSRQEETL